MLIISILLLIINFVGFYNLLPLVNHLFVPFKEFLNNKSLNSRRFCFLYKY